MPVNINDDVYDEVHDEVRVAISHLLKVRDNLGLTDETQLEGSKSNWHNSNKTIIRYALEVYRVWAALYPHDHADYIERTKEELKYERSVKEAIKSGGYSPTSYDARLDQMYRILIPGVKTQDKRFWKPMFESIPELKRSSYA